MRILFAALTLSASLLHGQAVGLSNNRISVSVLPTGGTIASIVLADDPSRLNPLWDPPKRNGSGYGHFLCVDGFGSPSAEEREAGLSFHGEAYRTPFEIQSQGDGALTLSATLPLVQEKITRTYRVRPGEPVLYVDTRIESLVAFDRPIVWAEHATIGSPFLEAGVTLVDISGSLSQTRPWTQKGQRRLASGSNFSWPMAPVSAGGLVDLRAAPASPNSMDHTTTLMDPSRKYAFATAIHPGRQLLVGWMWRRADFPWLQIWESYSPKAMARGLEFSTQPFDIPRREAVAMSPLFDTPTFRWLPGKASLETSFVMFYTRIPEGFRRVADARVEGGSILLTDGAGRQVSLAASGLP